jgi:proteasome lid subunit RPN8/RPN11
MSEPLHIAVHEAMLKKMQEHARQTYPEECCGLILGTEYEDGAREIVDILEITNARVDNRARRFLVTPDDYRYAEQQARNQHLSLLGWYHSHPDHPAQPSAFDREHAMPWFSYVIVSVMHGKAETVRSWRLSDDRLSYNEETVSLHTPHTIQTT